MRGWNRINDVAEKLCRTTPPRRKSCTTHGKHTGTFDQKHNDARKRDLRVTANVHQLVRLLK